MHQNIPAGTETPRRGFTLIEILLVIALIAVLATATIMALNPKRQFVQANDSTRATHVNAILNAVNQYMLENKGEIPATIPTSANCYEDTLYEICKTNTECASGIDLSVLTESERYLPSIPVDPLCEAGDSSCYSIVRSENDRITVCAPHAEGDANVSVTR